MAGYYPSSCDDQIPVHNCDPCEAREYGRIRSGGLIKKDFVFVDETDDAEWVTAIQNKDVILLPEINGELSEPSEKTGPGYGDTTETLLGYDFVAKIVDPNYSSNADFYNALVGNRNYKFFYRTSSKTHITPVPVTVIPKTAIANDLNSEVTWNLTIKWMSSQFPIPFNTPESIKSCYIPE